MCEFNSCTRRFALLDIKIRVIKIRVLKFISEQRILINNQFGFRTKKSTSDAIDDSLQYILEAMATKHTALGLFCDLQKAFDCIEHDLLIKKLEIMGIRGKARDLLQSYLFKRQQSVEIIHYNFSGDRDIVQSERDVI